MNLPLPSGNLGDLGNLIGLDGIVIIVSLIVLVVGLVSVVSFVVREGVPGKSSSAPENRLRRLESMRDRGTITEAEYQEQRRRILAEL